MTSKMATQPKQTVFKRQGLLKLPCLLPQTRVRTPQVEQGNVEQGAWHIFRPDLSVLGNGVRLRKLPACANMNDRLNYGVTFLVHKGEGCALIGNGQSELILIHKADLLNLRSVVDVIEKDRLTQNTGTFG